MINAYDPIHPDGPIDPEDVPSPLVGSSWLQDEDPSDRDSRLDFSLVAEDPE